MIVAAAFAALACCCNVGARAQADNPLESRTDRPRIGGEIGFASVWQKGVYTSACGTFVEGAGINPVFALAYDYPITGSLRFEALAGLHGYSLSSSYASSELTVVRVNRPGGADSARLARVNVDFENKGTASFTSLFLLPSLKLYIGKTLFFGAGVNAGLVMGGTSQYTKNITSRVVDPPDMGPTEIFYPDTESSDPYSKVYPEETIANRASLAFSAVGYVGAEFPLSRNVRIGPRVLYQVPLSAVVTDPELKLNALTFLVGVRFNINN